MDWNKVYEKYKIEVKDGGITWKGKHYPKHIVDIVENITFRFFPAVTEDNVDVLIAYQLSILQHIVL